ncbi:MAG: efflux RND transporter permease subunit [Halioglobus sp.]
MKMFLDRPNLAIVLSILLVLGGIASLLTLPVGRYPDVAPPTVEVTTYMDGANADIVARVIAPEIERRVNGVEGMEYMKSTSSADGSYTLEIVFGLGQDIDRAVTLVQNRVNRALPELPQSVVREGVVVQKVTSGLVMALSVFDDEDKNTDIEVSGFAGSTLLENLQRVPGVSKVWLIGEKRYSMRIWTDPKKMARFKLNVDDIEAAVREQNRIAAAGRIIGDDLEFTIMVKGGLNAVEEFEDILVRAEPQTRPVRIRDIGRVELGAQTYIANAYTDNKDGAILFVYRTPDANSMDVGAGVKQALDEIAIPPGMKVSMLYDTTAFIAAALFGVVETLIIAVVIVSLVSLFFLQSWRTTVITVVTIPVSLIGTFAVFKLAGISITIISMFGLILAIGIVVDAAIIVVENIERLAEEEPDLEMKAVIEKALSQVLNPIIASALVLLAVFAPTIFMGGMTGVIYSEFGIVLSAAVVVSTFVALTLTPAMALMMMRREHKGRVARTLESGIQVGVSGFTALARLLVKFPTVAVLLFALMCYGIYHWGSQIPSALIPSEDTSIVFVAASYESGTPLSVTDAATKTMVEKLLQVEGVQSVVSAAGVNLVTNAAEMSSNLLLVSMVPVEQRSITDADVAESANAIIAEIDGLEGFAFTPPPIPELGLVDGVDMLVKDLHGVTPEELYQVAQDFMAEAGAHVAIDGVSTQYRVDKPALMVNLDRLKAKQYGVDIDAAIDGLQSYTGGSYINTFNMAGRNYRVMVQNEMALNRSLQDLKDIDVSYPNGVSVKLGELFSAELVNVPSFITRHNTQQSVTMNVFPTGSTGDAIKAINQIDLPEGFVVEYSGITKQEIEAGNSAIIAFGLALLITFLMLVGQYESWSIPTVIILTVPTSIIGIVWGVMVLGGAIDVMTQIAAILLVGMCVRNAILIVEFAKNLRERDGLPIAEAAVEAVRLRTRAVAMTAFSFAVGVVPLMLADGTGKGGQLAIGYASFGGIMTATLFGCLIAPVFFFIIQSFREKVSGTKKAG